MVMLLLGALGFASSGVVLFTRAASSDHHITPATAQPAAQPAQFSGCVLTSMRTLTLPGWRFRVCLQGAARLTTTI